MKQPSRGSDTLAVFCYPQENPSCQEDWTGANKWPFTAKGKEKKNVQKKEQLVSWQT